jgi:hypothetical protein
VAPLHRFVSSISFNLMAGRRRHFVAGAEKTRICFRERPEPQSIPQRALLYAGISIKSCRLK